MGLGLTAFVMIAFSEHTGGAVFWRRSLSVSRSYWTA